MLITRETDYALRVLRVLSDGERHHMEEICNREAAPKQFAYRIVKKLEKAGWVTVFRGVGGGFCLKADLRLVSLYQLLESMGTGCEISACMSPEYECTRGSGSSNCSEPCHVHAALIKIQQKLDDELRSHSIHCLIFGDK